MGDLSKNDETHQKALALSLDGKWNEAEKLFQLVVNEDPANVAGWTHLGLTLGMQGNTKKAIDSLKHALKIDAQYTPAWVSLGQVYFKLCDLSAMYL